MNNNECSIWYEPIDTTIEVFSTYGHIYYKNCLHKSTLTNCPYCNKELQEDKLQYFTCVSNNCQNDTKKRHLQFLISKYEKLIQQFPKDNEFC